MPPKLGILAGGGPLPARLVEACQAVARPCFVLAFEGETDTATIAGAPHAWVRLGMVGEVVRRLRAEGCTEVVLAGPVRRPSLSKLRLDLRGMKLMRRIGQAAARGDNALLSVVVDELEREGFRVVGADDVLGGLLAPEGALGCEAPDAEAEADIAIGVRVARALGALDVGQAVVVQQGAVLGVEAIEGTDALIARCARLRREGPGGVLVKLKKPHQERRVDLPTVGVATVRASAAAGLRGIAVEAGHTLLIERAAMVGEADAAGLFIVGIRAP